MCVCSFYVTFDAFMVLRIDKSTLCDIVCLLYD